MRRIVAGEGRAWLEEEPDLRPEGEWDSPRDANGPVGRVGEPVRGVGAGRAPAAGPPGPMVGQPQSGGGAWESNPPAAARTTAHRF